MNAALASLLNDMLALSTQLHALSLQRSEDLENAEDEALLAHIDEREEIIDAMRSLEQRVDGLTDTLSAEEQADPDAQQLRARIRALLSETETIDMQTMRVLSERMVLYRNETIKARQKKQLAAYLETDIPYGSNTNADFTK